MVEIVINYSPQDSAYKIYEPSTQNLIVSQNLTEALSMLSMFLVSMGMIQGDILSTEEISYHLDSYSMKAVIESNVALMKRLRSAPSGFTMAGQRFGGSTGTSTYKKKSQISAWGKESKKKFNSRNATFSGAKGFQSANKKFGNKNK